MTTVTTDYSRQLSHEYLDSVKINVKKFHLNDYEEIHEDVAPGCANTSNVCSKPGRSSVSKLISMGYLS